MTKARKPARNRRPSPPAGLSTFARAEWNRLAPIAHRLGTLTDRTARSFEMLVEVLATERQARDLVADAGMTVKTGRDGIKPHPAVRTMELARAQATLLLKAFRLEPGRQTVAVPIDKPKGKSLWSDLPS